MITWCCMVVSHLHRRFCKLPCCNWYLATRKWRFCWYCLFSMHLLTDINWCYICWCSVTKSPDVFVLDSVILSYSCKDTAWCSHFVSVCDLVFSITGYFGCMLSLGSRGVLVTKFTWSTYFCSISFSAAGGLRVCLSHSRCSPSNHYQSNWSECRYIMNFRSNTRGNTRCPHAQHVDIQEGGSRRQIMHIWCFLNI